MRRLIATLLLSVIIFYQSTGQTSVKSSTIILPNVKFKKVLKLRENNYVLFLDANAYLESIRIDSTFIKANLVSPEMINKEKLSNYFKTHDTILVGQKTDKDLNFWLSKEVVFFKNQCLTSGNLIIYHVGKEQPERKLIRIEKIQRDEKVSKNNKTVYVKKSEDLVIFSENKTYEFYHSIFITEQFEEK